MYQVHKMKLKVSDEIKGVRHRFKLTKLFLAIKWQYYAIKTKNDRRFYIS